MPVSLIALDGAASVSSLPMDLDVKPALGGVDGWRSAPSGDPALLATVPLSGGRAAAGATLQQPAAAPPPSSGLAVPHVRQMYNWDCGLACVLMVLRAAGARGLDLRTLRTAAGTRSVWTVDLAHLLSAFGRGGGGTCGAEKEAPASSTAPALSSITLTTTWAGANPAYAGEAFYAATLEADRVRVGALFAGAPRAGVAVETRRVSAAELGARLVGGRTAIIALVDKSILAAGVRSSAGGEAATAATVPPPPPATPDRPPSAASPLAAQAPPPSPMASPFSGRTSPRLALRRRLSSTSGDAPLAALTSTSLSSASPEPSTPTSSALLHAEPPLPAGGEAVHRPPGTSGTRSLGYLGHYVVLCGYEPSTHSFTLRDPAAGPGGAVVPGAALDAARWAWGTDEDLLLVELAG